MTKYILQSGGLKGYPERASKFFSEIVKNQGLHPKILLCFFAEKREDWEMKFEKYQNGFMELLGENVQPDFELAIPKKFEEQVKRSEIIYIYGGDDHLLRYWLNKYELPQLWEGKVIATISAGANVLVRHFWTCDWRECMDGLGILPVKFIAHYKSTEYGKNDPRGPIEWEKGYDELKKFGEKNLPIHAMKEGNYIIIEK